MIKKPKDLKLDSSPQRPDAGNTTMSFVVLLALLINAIVIGVGGYYFWHQKQVAIKELAQQRAQTEAAAGKSDTVAKTPVYFKKVVPFDPLLTNLAGDNGRRILRLNIEVEVEGETVLEEIKKLKPILRDAIVSAAGTLNYEEANKPEGRDQLKGKILQNLNSHLTSGNKAINVFFTTFETN